MMCTPQTKKEFEFGIQSTYSSSAGNLGGPLDHGDALSIFKRKGKGREKGGKVRWKPIPIDRVYRSISSVFSIAPMQMHNCTRGKKCPRDSIDSRRCDAACLIFHLTDVNAHVCSTINQSVYKFLLIAGVDKHLFSSSLGLFKIV